MILYDRYPGGLGFCEKGYQHFDEVLRLCNENGANLRLRTRLPKLRRAAATSVVAAQRPRPETRLPHARQGGDAGVAVDVVQNGYEEESNLDSGNALAIGRLRVSMN